MRQQTRWIAAAAAAVGMVLTGPALAQMQSDLQSEQRGLYLGGGLGLNDDTETAWRLFGGYRAHRNLAVELGYIDLGETTIAGRPANTEAWELVGLGILPLNQQFSLYGKLGGYRGEARGGGITETRNDLTFGFGGQYDVSRNLGVRLEWQRYTDLGGGGFGGVQDQDVISPNAIYRSR
jgi:OmpA-OmpF porin, OOP family